MKGMPCIGIATAAWRLLALRGFSALSSAVTVRLYSDPATPQIVFAVSDMKAALQDYLDLDGVGVPAWRRQE